MAGSDNLQPLQFFHGTDAPLHPGELITSPAARGVPGRRTNRRRDFSFFTSDPLAAREYSPRTHGYDDAPETPKYVYQVEPTGPYDRDGKHYGAPNYKSKHPLKVMQVYDRTSPEAQTIEHQMRMSPMARELEDLMNRRNGR